MPESLSTRVLGERAQKGDQQAVNELLYRYQARILAAVRIRLGAKLRAKMESTDVVQEVMIDTLKRVAVIDFASEGAFMQYINRIVENKVRDQADHWNAQRRDLKKEIPLKNERSSGMGNPLDTIGTRSGLTPSKIVSRQEAFARNSVSIAARRV